MGQYFRHLAIKSGNKTKETDKINKIWHFKMFLINLKILLKF